MGAITHPLRRKTFAVMDARTVDYLVQERGLELAEVPAAEMARAMAKAEEGMGWVQTCITANGGDAVFVAGAALSYSDLVIASSLKWLSKASEEDWKVVSGWHDGRWGKLLRAVEGQVIDGIETM